jgi:excinuclease UvrABC nuclease subunit
VDSPGPPAASPRATVARLPLGPGVYRFRDAAGRVLYVGRAVCLRRRVASYWGDLGDRRHAGLAFEFAGRVQAELEAVDWITAEQKVTQAQPSDFDVLGWAGGVLVRFEVRAGRLSGWSQRACAAPAARRRLASASADPSPAWTDFARQTAELAALLSRCPG